MSPTQWRDAGRWVDWRGHRIFVAQHGEPREDARTLVCIHGFPTSSWDWSKIWPQLTRKLECVVAPDMLGFGYSDKPRTTDYLIREQVDLHEDILAAEGIRGVDVLAHDYGDTVAQEWLARHEDGTARVRLRSLVLLNGGLFPETHSARFSQKILASPLGPLMARFMNERRFAKAFSVVFGPNTRPSDEEIRHFWQLVRYNDGHLVAPLLINYMAQRRANRERWVQPLINARLPMRVINGPDDPVSGANMVARLRELRPDADVVSLPGIGHYPHTEAPQQVLDAFLPWLMAQP
jgi:pimeloyl-ACP methyl ester carboxylesterase